MKTTQCRLADAQVLLFLAGELEPAEAATVRSHLHGCPSCGALASELAETQDRVSSTLRSSVAVPPTLEPRVMATVRRLPPHQPTWPAFNPPWRRQPRTFLIFVGLGLLLAGYFAGRATLFSVSPSAGDPQEMFAPGTAPPQLQLTELRRDYLDWLKNARPVSVSGSDAQEVSSLLTARQCHVAPVAPVTFTATGTQMLGGCWHNLKGTPVAFLSYSWQGRPVSLYQADSRKLALPAIGARRRPNGSRCYQVTQDGDLSYVAWSAGATHYVLVAQEPPDRLLLLAQTALGIPQPT